LGFADEVWWSRLAQPAMHAWASPDTARRLVEKARAPHDLDPKALACYGLLVRALPTIPEPLWLRFAVGQPVSALMAHQSAGAHLDTRPQPPGQTAGMRRPCAPRPVAQ
jgi:hypothetical protein